MNSPAIDPLTHLRRRARRLVVAPADETGTRLVYAITHLHAPDLAAMPGLDVVRAKAAIEHQRDLDQRLQGCHTDEDVARVMAEMEEHKALLEQQAREEMFGSLERLELTLQRSRELIIRSVEAVGVALEHVEVGAQPRDTMPDQVCRVLDVLHKGTPREEVVYLRAVALVAGKAGPEQISVLDLQDRETVQLAMLFAGAFSVQRSVTPLPGEPRGAAVGRQPGPEVRREAQQLPADRRSLVGGSGRHGSHDAWSGD